MLHSKVFRAHVRRGRFVFGLRTASFLSSVLRIKKKVFSVSVFLDLTNYHFEHWVNQFETFKALRVILVIRVWALLFAGLQFMIWSECSLFIYNSFQEQNLFHALLFSSFRLSSCVYDFTLKHFIAHYKKQVFL